MNVCHCNLLLKCCRILCLCVENKSTSIMMNYKSRCILHKYFKNIMRHVLINMQHTSLYDIKILNSSTIKNVQFNFYLHYLHIIQCVSGHCLYRAGRHHALYTFSNPLQRLALCIYLLPPREDLTYLFLKLPKIFYFCFLFVFIFNDKNVY